MKETMRRIMRAEPEFVCMLWMFVVFGVLFTVMATVGHIVQYYFPSP